MGLGGFFKDIGSGIATGIHATAEAINTFDRTINPLHQEWGSASDEDKKKFNTSAGNAFTSQVEHVSQGMNWLYNNGISQPISTALMVGAGPEGMSAVTHASNWASAWHAADHISPGQALFLDPNQTQKAIDSPLHYYKPSSAYLPPGFDDLPESQQQQILKDAGMPATGNAYVEELRQSNNTFKNASGIGDFATRWWADPVILGGKVASAVRKDLQVVRRPAAGWSAQDINNIMKKSVMSKTIDFLYKNRENPQLVNNLAMARDSGMGPRFGAIISQLRSPQEVHDFVRVGLGDLDAIDRLSGQNLIAGARLEQDTGRFDRLNMIRSSYAGNPNLSRLINSHMDKLDQQISADTRLTGAYTNILDHPLELDQLNLSRWSFSKAEAATRAQQTYRARAARGIGSAATGGGHQVTIRPTPPLMFSRGTSTPVDLGFSKSRIYGIGDYFSTPVTVVRSLANARPNGFMRIDDITKDDIAELRGQLARIPGITPKTRMNMLNDYIKTETEGQRLDLLDNIGRIGAAKVAEKHGLDYQAGVDIYKAHIAKQAGEKDAMQRYSSAKRPVTDPTTGVTSMIHVDEFGPAGEKLSLHPNLVSRLANGHVFQDLDQMDKVLARNTSALSAIRATRVGNPDWILDAGDYLTHLFKFGTLFRLGYIPRVAGDDLAGQWARLGSAAMAMRVGWGVRNGATNAAMWLNRPMDAARAETAEAGAKFAREKMGDLETEMEALRTSIAVKRGVTRVDLQRAGQRLATSKAHRLRMDPATNSPARLAAQDALIIKREQALADATRAMGTKVGPTNLKLRDLESHHGWLDRMAGFQERVAADARKRWEAPKQIQGSRPVNLGNDVQGPAAFEGKEGEYYQRMITSDEALGQIFSTNKKIIHGHLMRSFDHGGKALSPAQDETLHLKSWADSINHQIVQDPLGNLAVRGMSPEQMENWLTHTAEGRAYNKRLGTKFATPEEISQSVWHDVAEYLPTANIRAKALEPGGVTPHFLDEEVPMRQRPDVHTGQVGNVQNKYKRALDDVVDRWFQASSTIPANRLSRHPLFNQMYEGHMKIIKNQLVKQGGYDTTVEGVNKMATTARRLALRDTKRLVFDIAHRTDASAAMRMISPFMTATNESFQRWGRILVDKPQVAGYANNLFNAPIARGSMQDADGNHVGKDGYSYTMTYPTGADGKPDYTKGTAVKRLVPKSQRYVIARMPAWLVHNPVGRALGADPANGKLKLSQNSADLVTQGDPWFSPGVGPIVQMPVNALVKDKPGQAEVARHLGVLPFGPQNGGAFGSGPVGEAASFFAPSTVKNFLTAFDTSDDRYQSIKLQMMQRAAYEHDNLHKPMPSASQLASQVRNYWMFSAASAFLQPMATQKADPYQFYRDQYNDLRRANPLTADDEFLARYGESYFIFAQATSENNAGIPATKKAVELSKKYASLISANPDLGALIVGPEGNGPFSPEAYSYQLTTPVTPGGSEMQRSKMSADQAMVENKKRAGWAKYTTVVNSLTAALHNRGLKSFNDTGAEDLKAMKSGYTKMLSQPLMPDGTDNPFYNDAWSRDYSTLDPLKYDRLIPGLRAIANSDLAKGKNRSDLRVLQTYLGARQGLISALAARKAQGLAGTITAKANADLADRWQRLVDTLIESDTRFGDLHSRYLSRDMGYDESLAEEEA